MNVGVAPRIVLLCHEADRIDSGGLASWLATSMHLVGIIALREARGRMVARARREIRRVGLLRFFDVAAFRLYYRIWHAKADATWMEQEVARLRAKYPVSPHAVPHLVTPTPNAPEVETFLRQLDPDLMIARCKFILRPEIFTIPRAGTWVLHPGICPEYRNAHGCFWALANRDLGRVGMTLLRVDRGVDTGPIFMQATYDFDERRESHIVIQYRTVLENLPAVERTLIAAWKGAARPIPTNGRRAAVWGQPWMSAYLRWKRTARRANR